MGTVHNMGEKIVSQTPFRFTIFVWPWLAEIYLYSIQKASTTRVVASTRLLRDIKV